MQLDDGPGKALQLPRCVVLSQSVDVVSTHVAAILAGKSDGCFLDGSLVVETPKKSIECFSRPAAVGSFVRPLIFNSRGSFDILDRTWSYAYRYSISDFQQLVRPQEVEVLP